MNAMDDELPDWKQIDLDLADRAAKLAVPIYKAGATDIEPAVWRVYPKAAQELINEGVDPEIVAAAVERARQRMELPPAGLAIAIPTDLHDAVEATYRDSLPHEASVQRLDEKWVKSITDFRMEIFHNESRHRGFPHVKVHLQDGEINISICEEPEVVAGKRGLRGEGSALKSVKKHRRKLKKFWDDTRPDDQKL